MAVHGDDYPILESWKHTKWFTKELGKVFDLKLDGDFELLAEVPGEQDEIGKCTGYIYRKI